jgi:hypothetical protein
MPATAGIENELPNGTKMTREQLLQKLAVDMGSGMSKEVGVAFYRNQMYRFGYEKAFLLCPFPKAGELEKGGRLMNAGLSAMGVPELMREEVGSVAEEDLKRGFVNRRKVTGTRCLTGNRECKLESWRPHKVC